MPDKYGWPTLPPGSRWLDEEEAAGKTPPEAAVTPADIQRNVGSTLRQIMGPPKQEKPAPGLMGGFVGPTLKKTADVLGLTDPTQLGITLASMVLTGPTAPGVKALSAVAPEAAGMLGKLGATGIRRVVGMGLAGAGSAALSGQDPTAGGWQGALTQLIGGEGARKLSQFLMASPQATRLAVEDPKMLGQVVSPIIPSLGSMRSPKDFFVAFKKGAAQVATSQAYAAGRQAIKDEVGDKVIRSSTMQAMRGDPALVTSGGLLPPGVAGMQAGPALQGGAFSFDDVMETIKRLRTSGYTEGEARTGLGALTARDRASALEKELLSQLTPDQAAKVTEVNSMYMRGQRLIDLLDDKKLLKQNGELNIPALQKKYKAMGYNVGQSYQLAADAANLENALFRGASNLPEDLPGKPGKLFGHGGISGRHGWLSFLPKLPELGTYAGRENAGLTPFQSSLVGQMLRRGVGGDVPNTLRDENAE